MANENTTTTERAHRNKWSTFAAMIATSIVTMFVLKYSNVYETGHIWFSQTRMWMALMMGMAMIVITLGFMSGMYRTFLTKVLVMIGALIGFALFLFLACSRQRWMIERS